METEAPVDVLDDPQRLAVLLSPLRRRLLGKLRAQPDSAAGLARALRLPRQQLNYHLHELERAGFVEPAGSRRRRGFIERSWRPTARAYLLSPELLGSLAADPESVRDRFSSTYLVATASRLVRDVTILRRRADRAGKPLATFSLQVDLAFRSPAARSAFVDELAGAMAALVRKYHHESPRSRSHRFMVGGHPVITKADEEALLAAHTEDER